MRPFLGAPHSLRVRDCTTPALSKASSVPKELKKKAHLIMRLDEVTLLGRALRLQSHAHEHNFSSTQNKIGAPKNIRPRQAQAICSKPVVVASAQPLLKTDDWPKT